MTIICKYSCDLCGLRRIPIEVPAREDATQKVVDWMDESVALVQKDHQRRSPNCKAEKLSEFLMVGTNRIGGPTVQ